MKKRRIDWNEIVKNLSPYVIVKAIRYMKHYGGKKFIARLKDRYEEQEISYMEWFQDHRISEEERKEQRKYIWKTPRVFSIVVPVYKTPILFLQQMIDSVKEQTYPHWELCIVNASQEDKLLVQILEKYAKEDDRIRVISLKENKGIAENTNAGIRIARGEFVGFLDHDDILEADALFEIAKSLERNEQIDVIYTDEDKVSEDTKRYFRPNFKPDYNIDFLRTNNYICHFLMIRNTLLQSIGNIREGFEGAQDYDLILRSVEKARVVEHIARVLYHWRVHKESTADNPLSKEYAYLSGEKAITQHLSRCNIKGSVKRTEDFGCYKVSYILSEEQKEKVSIIIRYSGNEGYLKKCLESVKRNTKYVNYEIVIALSEGQILTEAFVQKYQVETYHCQEMMKQGVIKNLGAAQTKGEYLLFLDDRFEILTPNWLENLLGDCKRENIAIVGAKAYFSDDTVIHAGYAVGEEGIHKLFYRLSRSRSGYFHKAELKQELSAVSDVCMMAERGSFEAIGGFDEEIEGIFAAPTVCLKIKEIQKRVLFTPEVELRCLEKKGIERLENGKDLSVFFKRFGGHKEMSDRYYNPNCSFIGKSYSLKV